MRSFRSFLCSVLGRSSIIIISIILISFIRTAKRNEGSNCNKPPRLQTEQLHFFGKSFLVEFFEASNRR